MRHRLGSFAIGCAAILLASSAGAAAPNAGIEGIWKVSRVVYTGANPMTWDSPQTCIWIFSRGYYSAVEDTSQAGRTAAPAAKDPSQPTDAEKLAKFAEWRQFSAASGTFEVKGSTLIQHPLVTKSVATLAAGDQQSEFQVDGDTAVVVIRSRPGQPPRVEAVTLTRLR